MSCHIRRVYPERSSSRVILPVQRHRISKLPLHQRKTLTPPNTTPGIVVGPRSNFSATEGRSVLPLLFSNVECEGNSMVQHVFVLINAPSADRGKRRVAESEPEPVPEILSPSKMGSANLSYSKSTFLNFPLPLHLSLCL